MLFASMTESAYSEHKIFNASDVVSHALDLVSFQGKVNSVVSENEILRTMSKRLIEIHLLKCLMLLPYDSE